MEATPKLTDAIQDAPIGALVGILVGYLVAKKLGYDKKITVISFAMCGVIIGTAIGTKIK